MYKLIINGEEIGCNSVEVNGNTIEVDTYLYVDDAVNRPTSSAVRMLVDDLARIEEELDDAKAKARRLIQMLEEASWFGLIEEVPTYEEVPGAGPWWAAE